MITPALTIVPPRVKGDIVYLDGKDITKFANATDVELFDATGVYTNRASGHVSFRLKANTVRKPRLATAVGEDVEMHGHMGRL